MLERQKTAMAAGGRRPTQASKPDSAGDRKGMNVCVGERHIRGLFEICCPMGALLFPGSGKAEKFPSDLFTAASSTQTSSQ